MQRNHTTIGDDSLVIKYQKVTLEEKADIYANRLDYYERKLQWAIYRDDKPGIDKWGAIVDELAPTAQEYYNAHKMNKALYARNNRLKQRIVALMTCGDCYFLTLTFDSEKASKRGIDIENVDEKALKRLKKALTQYLSGIGHYVANVDYGGENGRFHFHALVQSDKPLALGEENEWFQKWGAIKVQRAKWGNKGESPAKIAQYINKLTNHAVKNTVRNHRVIFSRGFDKFVDWDRDLPF